MKGKDFIILFVGKNFKILLVMRDNIRFNILFEF